MIQIDEQTGLIILALGLFFAISGYFWLVIRAKQTGWVWFLVSTLLAPLGGGIVFAAVHFRKVIGPVAFIVAGLLIGASPIAINKLFPPVKAPIESVTTGEVDLTLTGLKDYDYSQLQEKPGLTVLQMANPEVTDEIVEWLRPMKSLKRLDLSDSQITEKALAILAELPALEDLKLSRTKIGDEAIQDFLKKAPALKEITLSGTQVKTSTLRTWKNAKPEERRYVK